MNLPFTMTLSVVLLCLSMAATGEGTTLLVGGAKQLFIDDLFFESSKNISLKVHPAYKTGEKNLQREKPWESATLNWFTVMQDQGKYRMWYECYDIEGWPTGDDTSFCYAESRDGVVWTKPKLGLFTYQENTETNILFRLIGPEGAHSRVHGTGVFKDPSAPPEARYKAVSQGTFTSEPPHPISWGSGKSYLNVAGMVSPDGLHWTRLPRSVLHEFADSQYSCFWDDTLNTYILYGRVAGHGRAIGRSQSNEFEHFDSLKLVLQSDENDPPNSDLYNPAAMKYPFADRAYLMFPSLYLHDPDTLDVRLAVSRDGVHWSWPERDVPFVPLGEVGSYDSAVIYMGQGILRSEDELWQYYGGSPLPHNYEGGLDTLIQPDNGITYSRVITRLDGYVSARAGSDTGSFKTPLMIFEGDTLELNVTVHEGGSLLVGLLDENDNSISGYSTEDCIPIAGDHINAKVHWRTGTDVSTRSSKPTKMYILMTNADLYAFQFKRSVSEGG